MEFGSGCFRAIRNPVSHLPNDEVEMFEHFANHRTPPPTVRHRW